MFRSPRKGPWPPPQQEDFGSRFKAVISNIQEIVSGGILRSGKVNYGSGTGWWLGKDPADDESKFDIGTPTDYLRYDQSNGLQIAADGSGITNIDGGNIQAATITAAKLNVTNLQAVSAKTGALTVDNTLTMGAAGVISWMSGAAKITDDYMDVALTTSDRYAFRFLDSDVVHAYFAAYKSADLTQVSIEAIGPADTKYGKIALAAVESTGADPETVDMIIRSDTGVIFSALNYGASRIFKVDTMDAQFTNDLAISGDLAVTGAAAVTDHVTLGLTTSADKRLRNLYIPRWHNIKTTIMLDHQDEFALLTHEPNRSVTVTPAATGTNAHIFQDDSNHISWASASSPYPIVIEIDCSSNTIPHRNMPDYRLALTFRGTTSASPAAAKVEAWDNTASSYTTVFDTTITIVNNVVLLPLLTAPAGSGYNIYKLKITLTGTNPLPAVLRLQRVILYHGTHTWDPWHLHRLGGTVYGNVGIGAAPTAKLDVNSDIIRLRTAKTPASAAAAGNAGDICWDASYIYVCTAANTWKRAAIATW